MASGDSPRRSTSVIDKSTGANLRQLPHSFPQRFEGAFESIISHFVDCIDGTFQLKLYIETEPTYFKWPSMWQT